MSIARRRFLAATSLAGFGAAALALMPGRAHAIRLEEGDAVRQSLLQEACETRTAHEKVIRELIDGGFMHADVATVSAGGMREYGKLPVQFDAGDAA